MYFVYLLTNSSNGKTYVGFTNNIHRRMIQHKSSAATGSNYAIHRAIRKYGYDKFTIDILFQGSDREFILKSIEPQMITKYNSRLKGYNMTSGGEGQIERIVSKKTKAKMRRNHANVEKENNPFWGKKHTKESRKLMSEQLIGKPGFWTGKKFSKEHRMKLRLAKMGNQNRKKKVNI